MTRPPIPLGEAAFPPCWHAHAVLLHTRASGAMWCECWCREESCGSASCVPLAVAGAALVREAKR